MFVRRRNVSRVGEARPSSGVGESSVSGELEARSGELGLLVDYGYLDCVVRDADA